MQSVIVSSEDEITTKVEEHECQGLKCAAMSNTGLPQGQFRLTFLPKEAFVRKPELSDERKAVVEKYRNALKDMAALRDTEGKRFQTVEALMAELNSDE